MLQSVTYELDIPSKSETIGLRKPNKGIWPHGTLF